MENDRRDPVGDFYRGIKSRIATVLPPEINAARYGAVTLEYLRRNGDLLKCDRYSLTEAVVNAAMLGLELGLPFELAEVLPFKSKDRGLMAHLIVQYRGHMALVYRSGMVKTITARPVYANDFFKYEFGSAGFLRHQPTSEERGELVRAYALAHLKGGAIEYEVITHHDANAARKDSPGAASANSLWNKRPAEMWCKTAIKKLANRLPRRTAHGGGVSDREAFAPEITELLKAITIAPDLYSAALSELNLEFPSDIVSTGATLAHMRRLHKQRSGAQ